MSIKDYIASFKAEMLDELNEDVRTIAKGFAAVGRNMFVIGNAVESASQLTASYSKFAGGQRKEAGVDAIKGVMTFAGVDAQMLSDNVQQVKDAFKNGGIYMGISAVALGVAEVVGTALGGSQFVGASVREQLHHSMFGGTSQSLYLNSRSYERTHAEVIAAKQAAGNIVQHHRAAKGPGSGGP